MTIMSDGRHFSAPFYGNKPFIVWYALQESSKKYIEIIRYIYVISTFQRCVICKTAALGGIITTSVAAKQFMIGASNQYLVVCGVHSHINIIKAYQITKLNDTSAFT